MPNLDAAFDHDLSVVFYPETRQVFRPAGPTGGLALIRRCMAAAPTVGVGPAWYHWQALHDPDTDRWHGPPSHRHVEGPFYVEVADQARFNTLEPLGPHTYWCDEHDKWAVSCCQFPKPTPPQRFRAWLSQGPAPGTRRPR